MVHDFDSSNSKTTKGRSKRLNDYGNLRNDISAVTSDDIKQIYIKQIYELRVPYQVAEIIAKATHFVPPKIFLGLIKYDYDALERFDNEIDVLLNSKKIPGAVGVAAARLLLKTDELCDEEWAKQNDAKRLSEVLNIFEEKCLALLPTYSQIYSQLGPITVFVFGKFIRDKDFSYIEMVKKRWEHLIEIYPEPICCSFASLSPDCDPRYFERIIEAYHLDELELTELILEIIIFCMLQYFLGIGKDETKEARI